MSVEQRAAEAPGPTSIFAPALRLTSAGVLILITLIAFEGMAVSAALPTAVRAVHGIGSFGWAFTGFLVANIVAMVTAGQISDSRGPRIALIAGLVCFVCGLLLSGTATTMVQFVAGRFVQGAGGGLIITAAYVVIGEVYPPSVRPRLFAATSSAWVLPSLLGPLIAGLLAQHASWRWVFLGLVPFVLIGAVLMIPVLRSLRPPAHRGVLADPKRLLYAIAVAAGVAALEQAGQHPGPVSVTAGVVGLAAVVWGLRHLLPAGTFRVRPGVSAPIALRGLFAGVMVGVDSAVPLGLSVQHGFGATAAGLPLTVAGVSWAFGSWWQGRVDDSRGPAVRIRLIRSGFLLLVVAAATMTIAMVPGPTGWVAYPAWLIAGLGAGFVMSSVSVLMLNYTTDANRGADSASLQLSDATAAALTTGVGGVLLAAAANATISYTTAFVTLDLALAGVAAVGAVAARRARPARVPDAVPTPAP